MRQNGSATRTNEHKCHVCLPVGENGDVRASDDDVPASEAGDVGGLGRNEHEATIEDVGHGTRVVVGLPIGDGEDLSHR